MSLLGCRNIFSMAVAFAVFGATVGCIASVDSSQRPYVSGGLVTRFVDASGELYSSFEGGRYRGDLLHLSMLVPADGPLKNDAVSPMAPERGRSVVAEDTFTIGGMPEGMWLVGRAVDKWWGSDCRHNGRVYLFTVADEVSSTKSDVVGLTASGLTEAGWPEIDWLGEVSYQGRNYRSAKSHYTGTEALEVAFPWASVDRSELIKVEFSQEFEPPYGLSHIFTDGTVTDYVRVYRLTSDSGGSDEILVDPCPDDLMHNQYVIFRKVNAEEYVGVWE